MRARWTWLWSVAVVVCLAAGCESEPQMTDLAARMEQERAMALPIVSGPHEEVAVKGELAALAKAVLAALADSKIELVETTGQPAAGRWFLGKSLAGRQVLVEILPILPERAVIKVTVEGGDLVTQELLDHVTRDIARRTR
jgi:hypothetical protein